MRKLNFLDVLITRTQENDIKTTVFRKKTHTGQYINYHSNQPLSVRLSIKNANK